MSDYAPKAGRRAGRRSAAREETSRGGGGRDESDRPPVKKSMGWGSPGGDGGGAGAGAGRPRAGRRAGGGGGGDGWTTGGTSAETERKTARRNRHFDDDGDDGGIIQLIPDLESEEEEDMTRKVAEAPRNTARRVQTLNELEDDVRYSVPSATSGGIDLSLLTSALSPSDSLQEEDVLWEFDTLLQKVAQAMQADIDRLADDEDD